MTFTPVPADLSDFVKRHPAFYILPHIEPDGDCIGSALALASFLERLGKRVFLHNLGPFERRDIRQYANRFAGRIEAAHKQAEPEAGVIIVDCSTLDRVGELAEDIADRPIAVIDHHTAGRDFGQVRHINPAAPSCSLLIQQLIETMGYQTTPAEAEWLFLGFCTDTGFFRHLDEAGAESLTYASRLVAQGASPKRTFSELNSGADLAGRKHLGVLVGRVEAHHDNSVLLSYEYLEETLAIGKKNRESDLLYQLLFGIAGVEVVISLREETKTKITGGLRSRSWVDVGEVALSLGGGGHKRASGFALDCTLDEAKARVLAAVTEGLKAAGQPS